MLRSVTHAQKVTVDDRGLNTSLLIATVEKVVHGNRLPVVPHVLYPGGCERSEIRRGGLSEGRATCFLGLAHVELVDSVDQGEKGFAGLRGDDTRI